MARKRKKRALTPLASFAEDPRGLITSALGVALEDDGRPSPNIRPGDLLVALEGAVIGGNGRQPDLHFTAPIPCLLLLDFATGCRSRADKDRRKLCAALQRRDDEVWGLGPKTGPVVFDTIANEVASVTFSWMALEAFANFALGKYADDAFRYEQTKPNGSKKSLTARNAEKDLSVMEKAMGVLPTIFPAEGELPTELAADLDALRDVRRRTEHLKADDRYMADNPNAGPMGLLLVGRVCAPLTVCRVLRHFGQEWVPEVLANKITALDASGLKAPKPS